LLDDLIFAHLLCRHFQVLPSNINSLKPTEDAGGDYSYYTISSDTLATTKILADGLMYARDDMTVRHSTVRRNARCEIVVSRDQDIIACEEATWQRGIDGRGWTTG
jgi:hypothetical protein